ncbi:sodium/potassium-transporting ATPase subunit beta-2 [Tribolium castaneum]|uniref:Sodium/potassium-transporting ATPase subunit beta-2-like Protein n=1 Tax=Tribolium castaneum TaxID=7070 RepID=D6WJI8_TRICA|nr:PREDICTED: sodium/potassium-transporting ATPase subunit beta-2 [Tribolium castaneum]EFA03901.1 Sodium/potassium-transporting ATPase subunit beta-2-like Protein [Tribolium castaneum]|eukprot:XP_972919.1 PREDICTED: sodium/potassium-transporting ATPase subunit beta-2 [Tribolium castaneum]
MADKKADQFYTRPPKLGKWEGFKIFLWNPETSQFLGRTGSSWGKILLFYLIFYAVLVGFFAAMLAVFYQTLDDTKPKWQGDNSLIGSNPGLGFRPMPPDSNVESTLIWYKTGEPKNVQYWIDELDKFLEPYQQQTTSENVQNCDNRDKPDEGKFCDFKVTNAIAPCNKDYGYGFGSKEGGGPCIFLKLNKIFGWVPDYYTNATAPSNMPKHLRDHIAKEEMTGQHHVVWVDCEGENPADVENIGPIYYFPQRGFKAKYFPFTNVKGYVSPLVAVHFEKPTRGVLINIECKAWARNIHHDRVDRRGSVHFELMVD